MISQSEVYEHKNNHLMHSEIINNGYGKGGNSGKRTLDVMNKQDRDIMNGQIITKFVNYNNTINMYRYFTYIL